MPELVLKVAAKALIVNSTGKVLILREANTYKEGTNVGRWGLPGGRLNIGESYEEGLKRECIEETGLEVVMGDPVHVGEWRPVIKSVPHQIIAIFSAVSSHSDEILLSEEHDQFAWVSAGSRATYPIMEPDASVVNKYFERLADS